MKTTIAALLLGTALPGLALAQTNPAMTESHARSAMGSFGCNNISALGTGPDGSYYGQCSKGGRTINVMMDRTGKVSEATSMQHVTEGQARYALGAFGCNNISALGAGPNGSWYGQCSKGGSTQNVMVDSKGVASVASSMQHITEGQARYALGNFGCNNVSSLSMGGDGSWYGQCAKGGRTQNVMVDRSGKASSN